MFKVKEYGLRLESMGTVSKVKMSCKFTKFDNRSLFLISVERVDRLTRGTKGHRKKFTWEVSKRPLEFHWVWDKGVHMTIYGPKEW